MHTPGLPIAPVGEDAQRPREKLVASLAASRPSGAGAPVESRLFCVCSHLS